MTRCLLDADKEAQAALIKAEGDAGKRARDIDTATGRSRAPPRRSAKSMRAFADYRKAQCDFVQLDVRAAARGAEQAPARLHGRRHAPPRARASACRRVAMSITLQDALQRTIEHREIFHDEMLSLMRQIMSGEVSPVMIAALTVGLRVKKETIGEIAAAAQVMRELRTKVEVADREHLVDIVGTGGDASHTFNISTASMFVAAAAGRARGQARQPLGVVEVGQRRRARGARRQHHAEARRRSRRASPRRASASCSRPNHHAAMKHAAPVRRELGVRTIFNILGPLTNPAGAPNQLIGVFHPDLVGIHVRVLQRLGAQHVLVVYGKDGMDEVSLGAATMVGELKDGEVREYEIHPEDFGLSMKSNRGLKVTDAAESKEMVLEALANVEGTPREIVTLNAGDGAVRGERGDVDRRRHRARARGDRERRREAEARRVRGHDAEARAASGVTSAAFRRRRARPRGVDEVERLAAWNMQLIRDERHDNTHERRGARGRDCANGWPSDYRACGVRDRRARPFGYALFRELPDCMHLRHFFVEREVRRRGLGRRAFERLRRRGFPRDKRVLVEVLTWNAAGLAFWKSVGFSERYLGLSAAGRDRVRT